MEPTAESDLLSLVVRECIALAFFRGIPFDMLSVERVEGAILFLIIGRVIQVLSQREGGRTWFWFFVA